jgi:CheY-like chemotaxis protein
VGGQMILVIEDERNILLLVRSYLEREGFNVLAAEDGLAGLELAKRQAIGHPACGDGQQSGRGNFQGQNPSDQLGTETQSV